MISNFHEVWEKLRQKGVYVSKEWCRQCVEYLNGVPNFDRSKNLYDRVFEQFLFSDYYEVYDNETLVLGIPDNFTSWHKQVISSVILQVDEVVNVGASFEQSLQPNCPQLLKLLLTNGKQKVLITDGHVHRGALLFRQVSILGGEVDRLSIIQEQAKQFNIKSNSPTLASSSNNTNSLNNGTSANIEVNGNVGNLPTSNLEIVSSSTNSFVSSTASTLSQQQQQQQQQQQMPKVVPMEVTQQSIQTFIPTPQPIQPIQQIVPQPMATNHKQPRKPIPQSRLQSIQTTIAPTVQFMPQQEEVNHFFQTNSINSTNMLPKTPIQSVRNQHEIIILSSSSASPNNQSLSLPSPIAKSSGSDSNFVIRPSADDIPFESSGNFSNEMNDINQSLNDMDVGQFRDILSPINFNASRTGEDFVYDVVTGDEVQDCDDEMSNFGGDAVADVLNRQNERRSDAFSDSLRPKFPLQLFGTASTPGTQHFISQRPHFNSQQMNEETMEMNEMSVELNEENQMQQSEMQIQNDNDNNNDNGDQELSINMFCSHSQDSPIKLKFFHFSDLVLNENENESSPLQVEAEARTIKRFNAKNEKFEIHLLMDDGESVEFVKLSHELAEKYLELTVDEYNNLVKTKGKKEARKEVSHKFIDFGGAFWVRRISANANANVNDSAEVDSQQIPSFEVLDYVLKK